MATPPAEPERGERLQKLIARAGIGSRRVCEDLIRAGRVAVNGAVATLGDRADPVRDEITLDGVVVVVRTDLVHYLLNKPRGVVTTASDPQGRPTVVELVPADPRVFPVGRLDLDTEGLLLLTNDGTFANLIAHPRHGIAKTYLAEVEGEPSRGALRAIREGVDLDDGPSAPAEATVVARRPATSMVEIVVHEGRNRIVRRIFDALGHPVVRLVRTNIGPLRDPDLAPGAWRSLTATELRCLYVAASADAPPD